MAASGDLHCSPQRERQVREALEGVAQEADLLLLAGDLTSLGEPEEGAALARICAEIALPTFAVLGNHDWHANRRDELVAELQGGGVQVLEGGAAQLEAGGHEVGIVGTKGFVGGFSGHSHLDDFGEPMLRALYREAGRDVEALQRGLQQVALCPLRIVLLHYSPTRETLVGEPDGIWVFLGNDRLAAPILQHEPDLVLHGHAHAGTFAGAIGEVAVRNVSMPVLRAGYELFELQPRGHASAALH
ncbi:MAG TPA: metallophosphoesterase [Solirubrobacteraceae bacterium]